jgi:integrase
MPLTAIGIKNAQPGPNPKRLWDADGLYLEISPAGGKWWRLKYRFAGKEKRLALGVFPAVSLQDARAKRDDTRKLLRAGIDPGQEKRKAKAAQAEDSANSFEAVAREWFTKQSPRWAPGHSDRWIRLFERDIFPWIGARPVSQISASELLTVLRRIESRGAVDTAHRALASCGQVFRYSVASARNGVDPTGTLKGALAPVDEGHFPAVTEPARLAVILRMLGGYQGTLTVRCALRLAPLLFVRPGELRKAQWKDIDLDSAQWRFKTSKTKVPLVVPLCRQALAILRELYPLTGCAPFVFPSARSKTRPMSDNALLAAMRNMGIDNAELTTHGFRATARTILAEVLGVRPDIIEHQLGHKVSGPLGTAYDRTSFLAERERMMEAWGNYLEKLEEGAKILPFKNEAA